MNIRSIASKSSFSPIRYYKIFKIRCNNVLLPCGENWGFTGWPKKKHPKSGSGPKKNTPNFGVFFWGLFAHRLFKKNGANLRGPKKKNTPGKRPARNSIHQPLAADYSCSYHRSCLCYLWLSSGWVGVLPCPPGAFFGVFFFGLFWALGYHKKPRLFFTAQKKTPQFPGCFFLGPKNFASRSVGCFFPGPPCS